MQDLHGFAPLQRSFLRRQLLQARTTRGLFVAAGCSLSDIIVRIRWLSPLHQIGFRGPSLIDVSTFAVPFWKSITKASSTLGGIERNRKADRVRQPRIPPQTIKIYSSIYPL
jgi:hypothetical protein